MKTEREMLVLAAKAAGIPIKPCTCSNPNYPFAHDEAVSGKHGHWNPLVRDGDALRLAVKLGINTQNWVLPTHDERPANSQGQGVLYPVNGTFDRIVEWYTDGDAVAATRRAITRAAAEIGKSMP